MKSLAEFAALVSGEVQGDPATAIDRIAAIEDVDDRALTFATDERYLRNAVRSRAAAVLTEPAIAAKVPETRKPLLLVASARAALATILRALEAPRPQGPFRHPSAVVEPSASIGEAVFIGPLVYVGADAVVGARTVLHAGAVVGAGARVGAGCTLHPRAMLLDRCVAGDAVELQAGAVVGSDGFGYVFIDGGFKKIPQVGNVELDDGVEIGANTCIDRAQTGTTRIGRGTKIDNLIQVAHNVRIGANCGFAAQTGIAGSTSIGDYTIVGGQSGVNGHITIGSRVKIAGASHIWSDLPDDVFVSGRPAHDHREELRKQVRLKNLEKLYARVDALEKRLSDD